FLGGQLGNRFGFRRGRLQIDGYWKVAVGWAHESVDAGGATVLTGPVPPAGRSVPGGLLVVPTNGGAGRRAVDDLAIVPELGVNLGYDVTNWLRLTAGYSALYWSRVVRPGSQI